LGKILTYSVARRDPYPRSSTVTSARTRCAIVVSLALMVALGSLAVPSAAHAAAKGRFALGDSVMQGAKPRLENRGFSVNTAISRQVSDGVDILRSKKRNGTLRKQVVVHLGTNGTFSAAQCRAMHRTVGKKRNLYVVTVKVPRQWEGSNNRVIRRCAKRYKNTFLIDWKKFVAQHNGLVESDGYHLTPRGQRKYAALVDRKVDKFGSR
jgi:hypothetical protein